MVNKKQCNTICANKKSNPVKPNQVTTYQTIDVDTLSKEAESNKKASKPTKRKTPKDDKKVDMVIIHKERKPWSLPFTISVAIAGVLIFLAMITGFPTIVYTILRASIH